MSYAFGDFRLDPLRFQLLRAGAPVAIEPQVFSLLALLVEAHDRVVTKDEVFSKVWRGRVVSDAALNSRISAARRAIGDDGNAQSMIRTVRSRGFRFIADVVSDGGQAETDADAHAIAREQVVRYCRTPDQVSIAYATSGSGRPLIKAANWLNHLEFDWVSPVWRDMFERLSARNTLVRYDARGSGLSDRDVADISFARFAADLEAVVDAAGHRSFALLGISQGAAVAIRYAVAHPERVSHLILWGGYARGGKRRKAARDRAQADAFLAVIRQGWGRDHPVFRKLFATLYLPDATPEQLDWWMELQRVASSPEVAARTRAAIDEIDITDLLTRVRAPTLILHSAHEAVAPLAEARLMAAGIKGARVVPLESANHMILPQEPDWQRAMAEIDRFLEVA